MQGSGTWAGPSLCPRAPLTLGPCLPPSGPSLPPVTPPRSLDIAAITLEQCHVWYRAGSVEGAWGVTGYEGWAMCSQEKHSTCGPPLLATQTQATQLQEPRPGRHGACKGALGRGHRVSCAQLQAIQRSLGTCLLVMCLFTAEGRAGGSPGPQVVLQNEGDLSGLTSPGGALVC